MNKENYRLICILSHMFKVFERVFYNQLNDFMKDKLSNILTGFGTLIVNYDRKMEKSLIDFFWLILKDMVFNQLL